MLKPCDAWAERLSAYLDNECTPRERAEVEIHLAACADCRATAELFRCDAQDMSAALTAHGASDGFADNVLGQVAALMLETAEEQRSVAQVNSAPPKFVMPKPEPTQRRHGGWRILEWAAVAGIMAVMAAIMFPVFAKAREKSRQTTCTSNLRQIATAIQMYVQDEGVYPSADRWAETVLTYVGSPKIFFCPADANANKPGGSFPNSYLYNNMLSGKSEKDITSPTDTPVVWCDNKGKGQAGLIVGFADGHTKFFAGLKTIQDFVAKQIADQMQAGKPTGRRASQQPAKTIPVPVGSQPTITPPTRNYGLADKLQIAYTANVSLQSDEVQESMESAELLFSRFDGFVLTSNYQKNDDDTATATVSGRVPSEKLGKLMVELDALGTLISRTVNGDDLTAKHIENIEALQDLAGSQRNLEHIGSKAGGTGNRMNVESQRNAAAGQANGLRVDEYKMKSRVTLAEVSVQIANPPAKPKPAANALQDSLVRSGRALGAFFTWVLSAVLIPLLIFAPVWGGVLGIVLYMRKRGWLFKRRERE
ncbi:MAG: DUF4349 domain-containing protein [Armatimonadota bacterium]